MADRGDSDYTVGFLLRWWQRGLVIMLVGGLVVAGIYLVDPDLSAPASRPLVLGVGIGLVLAFAVLGILGVAESLRHTRARSTARKRTSEG